MINDAARRSRYFTTPCFANLEEYFPKEVGAQLTTESAAIPIGRSRTGDIKRVVTEPARPNVAVGVVRLIVPVRRTRTSVRAVVPVRAE